MRWVLLTALALIVSGCGGDDEDPSQSNAAAVAGEGGTLVWALAQRPVQLDPLFAASQSERLISRQIHEPLVEDLSGPFEDPRQLSGLAARIEPSPDFRVWELRLRPGVRFQDGTPFNAQSVLANVARWQAVPERSGLPPQPALFVDAPKPDLVRFILAEPDRRLDVRLAAPELGILAPATLERAAGGDLALVQVMESGTGPFELRERSGDRLLLARNSDWWGSERALGPALDQLEFDVVPAALERVARLDDGSAEVAGELGRAAQRTLRRNPLLTIATKAGGAAIGVERSVRGISGEDAVPSLNSVWLTRIDAG